tara:strand:- start:308 stop:409 length:102 start_codon:yes stop_codon:yes gene_type:complete
MIDGLGLAGLIFLVLGIILIAIMLISFNNEEPR